jgi:hypothetical protein
MVTFCATCGTGLPPGSAFCVKCGSPVKVIPTPESETTSVYAATIPQAEPVPVYAPDNIVDAKRAGNRWLIGGGVAAIVLAAGLYFWIFLFDDMHSGAAKTDAVASAPAQAAVAKQFYTVTQANIRDKATTIDTQIIGKLPRGSVITGVMKIGDDGMTNWLELAEGKGFVAATNLSETPPPLLTKQLNDVIWVTDEPTDIWTTADGTGTLLQRASAGTKLTLAGLTDTDFIEIKLTKGGVGYLAGGAAILERLNGKPIAINFNPGSCTFGGELDGAFAKIGAKLRADYEALDAKEFANDAAREKAYSASEGKSTFIRMRRSFNGLALTAIAQHYESQSLYFADPPAKVIDAFRAKGFKIGTDGTFATTDIYAGITGTRGEGAAFGKSELGCGV